MEDAADQLSKSLGPEYVSFKNGHAYIEGHRAIALANEMFGFDGWCSELRKIEIDYVEEKNGRYNIGAKCIIRVTLRNGCHREDLGYGSSVNMPQRQQAYDKAYKEAVTDALKRTLRQFGEAMGNCLYNKEYVSMVRNIRPEPPLIDPEYLIRPRKRQKVQHQQPDQPQHQYQHQPQYQHQKAPEQRVQPPQKEQMQEPPASSSFSASPQPIQSSTPKPPAKKLYGLDDDSDEEDDAKGEGEAKEKDDGKSEDNAEEEEPVFVSGNDIQLQGSQPAYDPAKSKLKSSLPDRSFKVKKK